MAAQANPRRLGICRSGGHDDGAEIYVTLPGEKIQLRISGVPGAWGSGGNLETAAAGRDWSAAYRGIHDGSGSKRERACVHSSGLYVLWGGRRRGRNIERPHLGCFICDRAKWGSCESEKELPRDSG